MGGNSTASQMDERPNLAVLLMPLSLAQLVELSALLDVALDLEPSARLRWLEGLQNQDSEIKTRLRQALMAASADVTGGSAEVDDAVCGEARPIPPGQLSRSGMQWLKSGNLADLISTPGIAQTFRENVFSIGDTLDRYTLLERLGSGGMGEVWLAERGDTAIQRRVALKLPLQISVTRKTAERFMREQKALARLNHPYIASLYDAGVSEQGLPYIAMEYVDGVAITTHCDSQRLSIAERVQLFSNVLSAVAYAHAQLVVHRDLKPSNVMVTAGGTVKLLDFGVAKLLTADEDESNQADDLTRESGVAVTANYASPEQLRSQAPTVAIDVYSLGVMLYELLTGIRPYTLAAGEGINVLRLIAIAPPSSVIAQNATASRGATRLTSLRRKLKGDLDAVVMKALEFEVSRRYLTVTEFADDLQRVLENEPVRAVAAGKLYFARKFIQRNLVGSIAVMAVTGSLIAAAALTAWQASIAQAEAKRAHAVEAFLLRVFDANSYDQQDRLHAAGSTARELLDNGVRLLGVSDPKAEAGTIFDGDSTLQGAPLRDVLTLLTEVNADLSAHKEALKLGQRALAVDETITQSNGQDARQIGLRLTIANAALMSNERQQASSALAGLNAVFIADPILFSPSQSLLLKALQAFDICHTDARQAASLAAEAMSVIKQADEDRYLHVGIQRLADVFEQHNDAASFRLQELALALAQRRFGDNHPRTIEARLRALTAAASVGEIQRAHEHMRAVKLAITGEATPSNPLTGGWWLAAGRSGMDSPMLLGAAVVFAQFEMSYGAPANSMLDAAVATTIAARLRTGQDKNMQLMARTTYAQLALKGLRLDLADIHTRAALAIAKDRRDELAATAADLRADYLILQGDTVAARGLLERAQKMREEMGTALKPQTISYRLLREIALAITERDWVQAKAQLDTLENHIRYATYAERLLDAKRGYLLNAHMNAAQMLENPANQADYGQAALLMAQRVTSADLDAAQPNVVKLSASQRRLHAAGSLLQSRVERLRGNKSAACQWLAEAHRSFNRDNLVFLGGRSILMTRADLQLTCAGFDNIKAATEISGTTSFIDELLSAKSPMRDGRLVYALL